MLGQTTYTVSPTVIFNSCDNMVKRRNKLEIENDKIMRKISRKANKQIRKEKYEKKSAKYKSVCVRAENAHIRTHTFIQNIGYMIAA